MNLKRMTIASKIAILIILILALSVGAITGISYKTNYSQVQAAVGEELIGCANITTALVDPKDIAALVSGDNSSLQKTQSSINWIVDHKQIFKDAYVLSLDGTLLAVDDSLLSQGFKAGDDFYMDKEAISMVTSMKHPYYTDVYEYGGASRITGYAPIFDNGKPNGNIIAVMAVDFDSSVISTRTWETVSSTLKYGGIFPLVGAIIAIFVTRRIVAPIGAINSHLKEVAEGNLQIADLKVKSNDDLGVLTSSLNAMTASLRSVIEEVQMTSQQVADQAQELSFASSEGGGNMKTMIETIDRSKGNFEQQVEVIKDNSAAIEEMSKTIGDVAVSANKLNVSAEGASAAIEEMAVSIRHVAGNAEAIHQLSTQAKSDAFEGEKAIDQTLTSMHDIAEVVDHASIVMQNLGESSKEIGSIIEVIDDIADQTNLLALNAAIESARAGEHGKGFAVVADEVRKLAERSADATKEIASLIKGIQEETEVAITAVEDGKRKVSDGTQLSQKANDKIKQIVESINEISNQISQISFATSEQAKGSEEVVRGVSAVSNQTSTVTDATDEQSRSIKTISESAHTTSELANSFASELSSMVTSSHVQSELVGHIAQSADSLYQLSQNLKELINKFQI